MNPITELKQKRAAIVVKMREINERAENGLLNAEDRSAYDKAKADFSLMTDGISRQEEVEAAERAIALAGGVTPESGATKGNAFRDYLRSGRVSQELRALSADIDAEGGYMVPEDFRAEMIKALDDLVHVRRLSKIITVSGASDVGIPSITANMAVATWGTETASVVADSTLAFGKRLLKPSRLKAKLVVSRKLLRNSFMDAEQEVNAQLAMAFGLAMEQGYLTGNGTNQPLGLFTASADGIPTSRDVSAGNTTTAITSDNLFSVKYSVAQHYRGNASWLFHRDALGSIAKLQDGAGNYLWTPGLVAGQPDRLLGAPVYESEYVPNTFTSGLYVGLYGDFRYYWIADQLEVEIQRLVELHADSDQIGFIGRAATDGQPVLPAAFARVKLG